MSSFSLRKVLYSFGRAAAANSVCGCKFDDPQCGQSQSFLPLKTAQELNVRIVQKKMEVFTKRIVQS
jgi:hypothetical protein